METKSLVIADIKKEINAQVSDEATMKTLVQTTFKGLAPQNVKPAILEGMLRGFTFQDFLQKNIYAIPFKESYSLVTSIDWARKIGMRSGVVGKSAPVYTMEDKKIESCSITIKRKVSDYVGDYTATVFFSEYSTGRNLWVSKPRTMLAKVAEMHALRMACPEELAQAYVEEEREAEALTVIPVDLTSLEASLRATKSIEELKTVWSTIPVEATESLTPVKEELKKKFTPKKKSDENT